MRRVQAGETELFAEIARRYQAPLLRVALSRLGQLGRAEDAVQETLLAAFKSRHTYQESYSFRTWLWTILFNECRRSWSNHSRLPRVSCFADEAPGVERPALWQASRQRGGDAPFAQLLAQERTALLESSLERLPLPQADALRLRFFAGLKFQEIADTMGCSLGTAKNRVRWGLLRLSDLISRTDVEET